MCLNCVKNNQKNNNNNKNKFLLQSKEILISWEIKTVAERVLGKIKGIYSRCVLLFLCVKKI